MKRNTGWVLIALLVLFACFLLMPIGHAGRSEQANNAKDPARFGKEHLSGNPSSLLSPLKPRSQTEEKAVPISGQAVAFAVSDPVRDLPEIATKESVSDTSEK